MLKQFKDLELARHHLEVKARRLVEKKQRDEKSSFDKMNGAIFSAAFSIFTTLLLKYALIEQSPTEASIISSWQIGKIVLLFFMGIACYIVLYLVSHTIYQCISKRARRIYEEMKISAPDYSAQKNKELVDDFDNIVIDNLLFCYEFIKEINGAQNTQIKTLLYYELVYYLRTSAEITQQIISPGRQSKCININGNTRGIDLFRLINVQQMMTEIYQFVSNKYDEEITRTESTDDVPIQFPKEEEQLRNALNNQLKNIKREIFEIAEFCNMNKNNIISEAAR